VTQAERKQPSGPLSALACFSALTILERGLSLLLLPLYVRHIPPDEFGALAAVMIVAGVIAVASNLKLDAAMRTFYFDYCDDPTALETYLRQILSTSLYSAGIVYLVMVLAGERVFALLFAHEELRFFPAGAIALAAASINACLSCYFVYLRNSLRLWELVRWQLFIVVATVGLQILFVVVVGLGLYGVLWGSLLPLACASLWLFGSRPELVTARPDWRYLLPSLKYALPLIALAFVYVLGTRLDRLVLEHYVDLESLGVYAVLAGLLGLLTIVLNTLDNAMRPYLYPDLKSSSERPAVSVDAYQGLYLLAGLLSLSVAVFLGSNLHLMTQRPGYLAIQQWLLPGAAAFVPVIFTRYYALFFDFHKRSVALSIGVIARFGVSGVLLLLLVPKFGIAGALWAIFVSELTNALAFWQVAKRLFAVRTSLRVVATQLTVFLGTLAFLAYAVGNESRAAGGSIQLLVVAGLLLATNRRALRAIFATRGSARQPA
jgi:O-antigen/teichoic acid export membrane protein